jgi:hypothetical protein
MNKIKIFLLNILFFIFGIYFSIISLFIIVGKYLLKCSIPESWEIPEDKPWKINLKLADFIENEIK